MSKIKVGLANQKFGKLTVLEYSHTKNQRRYWKCKCDCGNIVFVCTSNLKNGHSKSCGCENKGHFKKTHGKRQTRLYGIWAGIKKRCLTGSNVSKWYKDKGIKICDEWKDDFECFYNWAMSNGYNDNLTIDRINPNSDYSPENCRWIPLAEQAKNTTQNKLITYNGKTMILADWARTLHIKRATISARLERGWSVEDALTKPVGKEAVNSKEFNNER